MFKVLFKFFFAVTLMANCFSAFCQERDDDDVFTDHESRVKIGWQTGLNISRISSDNYNSENGWETKPRYGFNGGLLVDIRFSYFTLQPGVLFSTKGAIYSYNENRYFGDMESVFRTALNYIEVPVHALYTISVGRGAFFIGGGPYFAYGIYGKEGTVKINGEDVKYDPLNKNNIFKETEYLKEDVYRDLFDGDEKLYDRFDFGIGLQGGYEFPGGFFIKVGYSLGLKNISNPAPGIKQSTEHNRCFDFSIGYKIKF